MTLIPRKFLRANAVKVGLVVLVCLIAAGFILPHAITLLIHARVGGWIDTERQIESVNIEDHFACLRLRHSQLAENKLGQMQQAIQWLGWANMITPNNAHTDYLLGQAYCLSGDFEQAVNALEAYGQKRPDNPLVLMEQGFAYFSWAQLLTDEQGSSRDTNLDRSILALEQAGIGRLMLIQHGDHAFDQRNYESAWVWYRLAQQHANLPEKADFRQAVLNLALNFEKISADFLLLKHRLMVTDDLVIQPSNLFRIGDGSPVRVWEIDGSLASVYFHSNDPAGVFIETVSSGTYCLAIEALDRAPSPTLIEVSLDLEPIGTIELTQGDETWQASTIETQLDAGWHLLSLRLEDNASVAGFDQNGLVGQVTIQKCH